MVKLEHVRKAFKEGTRERVVFSDLSMDFQTGRFFSLMGKSGTGKTTLLNLLCGIDRPDSGRVRFGEVDLGGISEKERTLIRRRSVGFIFQHYRLIPFLTVRENIRFLIDLNRMDGPAAKKRVDKLVERVGIGDLLEMLPEKLSGGEKQRVALVRALAHDPMLILADEPTGNLDESNSEEVMTLLSEVSRESGKTLIVVTHSVDVAQKADHIYKLHKGQLVHVP